ncbi:MAG: hypothetical protein UX06_C0045G0005 [Candidatus Giovannonibacteria bacterium GW2011_GWA2_45_21]|uniref:Uncharacterized protein n=1 Tax=Candidatus Giovannonibacteria bacterium GW2011_GWA2_45_21 TaxID=1618649 RepID=A0A0G1M4K4_9BACT|nr:MAG: hypothetical protein UX06_C0045G0005 [Candidatus Giovannonibacteria bacterium GW2011_GWA2_45_21]
MNQKYIFIIAVIVLLGIGGYYVATKKAEAPVTSENQQNVNTSDETANWKTYTNTKYGFEIKYPSTWKLKNNLLSFTTDNGRTATLHMLDSARFDGPTQNIYIGTELGTEWAGILCEQGLCSAVFKYHSSSLDSRGFSFHLVIANVDSDFDRSPGSPDWKNPRPIFSNDIATVRKALLTFEIVPRAGETANWKTYRNDKYGFEIKYPSKWFISESANTVGLTDYDATKYEQGNPEGTAIQFVSYTTTHQAFPDIISNANIAGTQDQFTKIKDDGLSVTYKAKLPSDGNCYYIVINKQLSQEVCAFAQFKRTSIEAIFSSFKFTK